MDSYLQQFQQACLEADKLSLFVSGVVITLFGLFLWLGGSRYAGLVVGLLGAALGALIGGTVAGYSGINPLAGMVVCAVVFSLASILLKKIIIVIIAIVIFSLLATSGYLGFATNWSAQQSESGINLTDTLQDAGQSITTLREGDPQQKLDELMTISGSAQNSIHSFWGKIQRIIEDMKPGLSQNKLTLILISAGGAIAGFILASLLRSLVMSLCCSIVGTTSTILGVMLLIMAKGNLVISTLQSRPRLLPTLFIIMVASGWFIQILITGSANKKTAKPVDKSEE